MADETSREEIDEQEQQWHWEEDEYDPELMELADRQGSDSVLRPILMLMVLVLGAFILSDWQEELAYYFSPSEPIELGNVTDFPSQAADDPSWSPQIPHNRYVELSGIPAKRSISKRYKYFKLIGGEIYIEDLRDDADDSELERIKRGAPKAEIDRSYYSGKGRAMSFAAMPKRYTTLREYYTRHYGVMFCVDLDEKLRPQIEMKRRDTIRQMWRKQWEEASEAERAAEKLTEQPTDAEIEEIMENNPVCVDAWLIQGGQEPSDHLWYVILAGLFGLFMLVDLFFLVRWVARFIRPNDDL